MMVVLTVVMVVSVVVGVMDVGVVLDVVSRHWSLLLDWKLVVMMVLEVMAVVVFVEAE